MKPLQLYSIKFRKFTESSVQWHDIDLFLRSNALAIDSIYNSQSKKDKNVHRHKATGRKVKLLVKKAQIMYF